MQTLKQILEQDHSKKTKKELVDLLIGVKEILGEDYGKITGIQASELSKTKNEDLLAIINDFRENYDAKWENNWAKASTEVIGMIFAQMEKDESFTVSAVDSADFAAELGSLDFASLIGGPLSACVTAQTNASLATVSFIDEVGFKIENAGTPDEKKVLSTADFSHKRTTKNPNKGKTPGQDGVPLDADVVSDFIDEDIVVIVPIIAMLTIPNLQIETCEIDFNVKLNSVFTKRVDNSLGIDASVSGNFWKVKFKVSASYRRSSSTGIKVEKEYTMGVKVKAIGGETPEGLAKVLDILAG